MLAWFLARPGFSGKGPAPWRPVCVRRPALTGRVWLVPFAWRYQTLPVVQLPAELPGTIRPCRRHTAGFSGFLIGQFLSLLS